jgi:hypothetical protein
MTTTRLLNQGFHFGALMAAKELGFDVTEDDIEKAMPVIV